MERYLRMQLLLLLLAVIGELALVAQSRRAVAEFSLNGVRGSLVFEDSSSENGTSGSSGNWVQIDSRRLHGIDHLGPLTWHVHLYPFKYTISPMHRCTSTGGHYDPHGKATAVRYAQLCKPSSGNPFRDCEVGDLSGKFGPLRRTLYRDRTPNMSVAELIGRSVVLHVFSGERFACANIVEVNRFVVAPYGCQRRHVDRMRTLEATFSTPVAGSVFIRQLNYKSNRGIMSPGQPNMAELPVTVIFSDLRTVSGLNNPMYSTVGLNWTVHIRQPSMAPSAGGAVQRSCGTGPVYSPMTMGRLRVQTHANTDSRTLLYTVDRLLSPLDRLRQRDLVLSDAVTSQRVACAWIEEVQPFSATAEFHRGIGQLRMVQSSVFDSTQVLVNLSKLANTAADYTIRETPLSRFTPARMEPDCTPARSSYIFAPFPLPTLSRHRDGGTPDMFTTGDLSGKYGSLRGLFAFHESFCDGNLPLFGPHSVIGRTVLVTQRGAARVSYTCARVTQQLTPGSRTLLAAASIQGSFDGRIVLQQVKYPDGSLGDTLFTLTTAIRAGMSREAGNFMFPGMRHGGIGGMAMRPGGIDGTAMMPGGNGGTAMMPGGHSMMQGQVPLYKFHVHRNRIGVPSSLRSVCDSSYTGPRYNPHNVTVDQSYSSRCSATQPHLCELGDTSGKVGFLRATSETKLRVDPELPLIGQNSVVGRSFVIYIAFPESGPIACGNILPKDAVDTQVTFLMEDATGVSLTKFKYRVALRLHISVNEVLFPEAYRFGRCTAVSFALHGINAPGLVELVRRTDLGEFTHNQKCEDSMMRNSDVLYTNPKVVEWLPSWLPSPPSSGARVRQDPGTPYAVSLLAVMFLRVLSC
eukprot:scpid21456/ scgid4467/ 